MRLIEQTVHPMIRWLARYFDVHGHSAIWTIQYQVIKFRHGFRDPYEVTDWTPPNLVVTTGLTHLVRLATGEVATTLNNANARIGTGDSSTAAAAGQTDLQAATNKAWVAMDATYPTSVASNATIFQMTSPAGSQTFTWNEAGIARGDPSAGGIMIGRRVVSFGSKGAGDQWVSRGTLTATGT